jgi:hypothetical protein
MEINMMVILKMGNLMVKGFFTFLMEVNMMGNGMKEKKLERELCILIMVINMMEDLIMIK